MEFVLKYILLIILFINYIMYADSTWIIEKIPQKRYSPKALALSGKLMSIHSLPLQAGKHTNIQHLEDYKSHSPLAQTVRNTKDQHFDDYNNMNSFHILKSKKTSKERQRNDIISDAKCDAVTIFAPDEGIPCNLPADKTPMFVYFSFDDATTSWNIEFYRRLFESDRTNPNGCPIRGTFFNSHDNTQYDLLKELYDMGHEVASHSLSHKGPSTWWSVNATKQDWFDEIVGQRKNIHKQTEKLRGRGVPLKTIRGMRAPFLAIGGDKQFEMLEENNFLYDSSIPNNNQEPYWPFTLHDTSLMNGPICRSPHCPIQPHSIWEVVMNVYFLETEHNSLPCSMVDGCRPDGGRQGAHQFLMKNFLRHYENKYKVPFGINMHAAWFAFEGYIDGMDDFIKEILAYDDVYIVPIHNVIEWMQHPRTLKSITKSKFGCRKT